MTRLNKVFFIICCAILITATACSSGGSGRVVKGTVTMDGEPLAKANLEFFDPQRKLPTHVVWANDQGQWEVRGYKEQPGLLPGKYLVRVSQWVDRKTKQPPVEEEGIDIEMLKASNLLMNRVPAQFSSTEDTAGLISVEIKPDDSDNVRIEVKTK